MRHMPTNSIDVKRANRNRIFRYIYDNPGSSRPELVQRLEMSLPTVMQNVKSLFEQGLVKEDGNLDSTGGRKAVALTCVKEARTSIGVEITRNHIGVVIINMDGAVLQGVRHRIPFSPDECYAATLGAIVDDLVASSGVDPDAILGAGVSLPGFISADGSVFRTTILPGSLHYPTHLLGDAIGRPTVYVNDANAAGIAEMWDSPPGQRFVYLSLSNSVGGAIVSNGGMEIGDNERAGEFGHITVEYGGNPCYCGQRGCLNAYCSASILADRTGGNLGQFFETLQAGDTDAQAAWNRYLDYLARAVNVLRMVFDCEVVLGGYVGAYMESHIDGLRQRVAELDSHEKSGAYARVCTRHTEASAVGAALVHIENFIRNI
ncbi:MAG: ROK family transcriptional regulator [Planctomycetaceae bacterium]|nr:ROK family transcriptional regulator [Planctomycetaceae bacterium]